MPVPRISLHGFLTLARSVLRSAVKGHQKITFVIGNESADLDSLVSSILLAYFRSSAPSSNTASAPYTEIYVPILNIPAKELGLRPEFTETLALIDLDPSDLITLDDLPPSQNLAKSLPPENTRWILVDHNALQGNLGSIYGNRLCGVIDHHAEEHKVPTDTSPEPRIIEKTASCSSLVVEYCRAFWDELDFGSLDIHDGKITEPSEVQKIDAQLARFALASVLVDSVNLEAKQKVTVHDVDAAQYLENRIADAGQSFDRAKFFKQINSAKSNLDGLSIEEILRKDYKQWTESDSVSLGISSVVKPIEYLVKKAGEETHRPGPDAFLDALQKFAEHRHLSMFAIMTACAEDQGFHREVLLWAVDAACVGVVTKFAEAGKDELKLVDNAALSSVNEVNEKGVRRKVWHQEELSKSRKKVAPMLRDLINKYSSAHQ